MGWLGGAAKGRKKEREREKKSGFIRGARRRRGEEDRLEAASRDRRRRRRRRHRRRRYALSTLHNTALVVNSMTFEQNAAVSPYDRPSHRGRERARGRFLLIHSLTAPPAVLFPSRPFYCLGSRPSIFKRRSYAKRIALLLAQR